MLSKIQNITVGLLVLALVAAFGIVTARHLLLNFDWEKPFRGAVPFGATCEGALGSDLGNADAGRIVAAPRTFEPMPMPLKTKNQTLRLSVPRTGYLIVRCKVPTAGLSQDGFAAVRLGRLYGESYVFINGDLRLAQSEPRVVTLPLERRDRGRGAELVIVSKPRSPDFNAGLLTSDPLVVTDRQEVVDEIASTTAAGHVEIPIFRLGLGLGLSLFFVLVWCFRINGPDVVWMIVLAAGFALQNAVWISPDLSAALWQRMAFGIFEAVSGFGMAGFALSFMRLPKRHRGFQLIVIASIGIYALGYAVLPVPWSTASLYRLSIPYAGAAALLAVAAGLGLGERTYANEKARRRAYALAGLTALAAILYLVQVVASVFSFVYVDYIKILFLLLFAGWLGADLAVFHRRLAEEQALRLQADTVARMTQAQVHDLQAPFSTVKMAIEAIVAAGESPAKILNVALLFQPEANRSLIIVKDILDEAVDLGQSASKPKEPVTLHGLVDAAVKAVLATHCPIGLSVSNQVSPSLVALVGASRLSRALVNIVGNGIEAMEGIGSLWIMARELEGKGLIELVIGNDGPAISQTDLGKIFEPGFTRKKGRGRGLGLYGAAVSIRADGGQIRCRSGREAGTEFILTIPSYSVGADTQQRATRNIIELRDGLTQAGAAP